MSFKEETTIVIRCPKCGSYDIDVIEAPRGCENPVMSLSITCKECMWEIVYFEQNKCIPIPKDMMYKLFKECCFDLQISTEEFVYQLIEEYWKREENKPDEKIEEDE